MAHSPLSLFPLTALTIFTSHLPLQNNLKENMVSVPFFKKICWIAPRELVADAGGINSARSL